jgi:hypothetical protein
MAWRKRRSVDITTSLPTGVPTYSKISSMVKQIINASQYDYHESESFEVTEVILNESGLRGAVRGSFINNPDQEILGGVVKPLMPNILQVPVVGEHVVVAEYNGQHFYTSIINRKGSVNENSIPGASGVYEKNTKYGETFERRDVQPISINEGDIVFEGRYAQSIKFGSNKQKPQIKIVAGHRGVTENIDNDDSSIYLYGALNNSDIEDKKIQIKSNSIFIKGSDIRLGTAVENDLQPVVKGDDLLELFEDLISALESATFIGVAPGSPTSPAVNVAQFTNLRTKLKNILSTKVKTQ